MVNSMKRDMSYNIFLLLSTFARNIIDVFSLVMLYDKGYSIRELFLFLVCYYLVSLVTNVISILIGNRYNYKVILVVSTVVLGGAFYYLSVMGNGLGNLLIYSVMIAISSYSYHSVRHYYGIMLVDDRKKVSNTLIFSFLPVVFASYLGAWLKRKFSMLVLVILVVGVSLLGIIPIFRMNLEGKREKISLENIKFNSFWFMVFEQFKVIFLMLEPLFLYLYVDRNMEYIGVFNIFVGGASLIFVYFLGRKLRLMKWFGYFNMIFCLVLVMKLNINNKFVMFGVAMMEGLLLKLFDSVSMNNFYNVEDRGNVVSYLMVSEITFCLVSLLICLMFYVVGNLVLSMYLCILGIFVCGLVKRKKSYGD